MEDPRLRCSIIVSATGSVGTLSETLESVLTQEQAEVECFVVDGNSSESAVIENAYAARVARWEHAAPGEMVKALNSAFRDAQGDMMMWLSGADKLCPWAVRFISFILCQLPQVKWLTSGTPLAWSPAQLCAPNGLADGYAKRAFFAGRNLKTSSYFHFPIWRAGTVWRRSLWQVGGSAIRYALEDAGDFELWMRFWENAELVTCHVPIGGTQAGIEPMEGEVYWAKAAACLNERGQVATPSPLRRRVQGELMRRSLSMRERWTERAPVVWIAPPTQECGISMRAIF